MTRILRFLAAAFLLTAPMGSALFAQKKIKYSYDAAGNRTERHVILLPANAYQSQSQEKPKEVFESQVGSQNVIIYPNPTQGQLLVEINGGEKDAPPFTFEIYSPTGTLLLSKQQEGGKTLLDLSAYPIGAYILRATSGGKATQWKVIKK